MRLSTHFGRGSVGFNMTPMIDVVFLLIIFFLVSSHLAQSEVQLDLDLPEAASGDRPNEEPIRRIVVNVVSASEIRVGTEIVDSQRLADMIRYEGRRARQAEKPIEVRIRADRRVPYGAVEPIMVACARGGIWNVTFAVVAGP